MRNRVAKLSPLGQTSSLEGFHSVVNQFCPKMIHFSYNVMYARYKNLDSYLYYDSRESNCSTIKHVCFLFGQYQCRIRLAALHFNENAGRPTKKNKAGNEEYAIKFPKAKKGGHTVVAIPTSCTYG